MSPRVSRREKLPEFTQTPASLSQRAANVEFWAARAQGIQNQDGALSPQIVQSPLFKRFCRDKEGTTLRSFFSKYLPELPPDEELENYYICYSKDSVLAITPDKNLFLNDWRLDEVLMVQYSLKDAQLLSKLR